MDELLYSTQIEALTFAGAVVVLVFTSWLAGRRARRVLGRALGREVRDGEDTSLRAWMSVPSATLSGVDQELRHEAAERLFSVLDRAGRYADRHDDHEPWSTPTSLR